jgi:uncharacterized protein (TIGR00290 family)
VTKPKAWLSWSSGKDSAFALHRAHCDGEVEVVGLLTTINTAAQRVAMHAVRRDLLAVQAAAVGLPVHSVELPWPCPNEVYERQMSAAVAAALEAGVEVMVFGDLFLQDIRNYRENQLAGTGIRPLFPLWGERTDLLAAKMVGAGLQAIVTCVDPAQAPEWVAGRWYDADLLAALPATVDPCGERGEFHTFAVDGPMFSRPVEVTVGEIVRRDGFVFADVEPSAPASATT